MTIITILSALFRHHHHPYMVCQDQKSVSGPLIPVCPAAGVEVLQALKWQWRTRKRKQKEGRKKSATTSRSLGCRCTGTECCLCDGPVALFSSPSTVMLYFPDENKSEMDSRMRTGGGLHGGV